MGRQSHGRLGRRRAQCGQAKHVGTASKQATQTQGSRQYAGTPVASPLAARLGPGLPVAGWLRPSTRSNQPANRPISIRRSTLHRTAPFRFTQVAGLGLDPGPSHARTCHNKTATSASNSSMQCVLVWTARLVALSCDLNLDGSTNQKNFWCVCGRATGRGTAVLLTER